MANILKTAKTYTDVRGVIYDDAYMLIEESTSSAVPSPSVIFRINIYKDTQSKIDGFQPIFSASVNMTSANIATYLGTPKPAASTEIPLNFLKKWIYIFLTTESPDIPTVNWGDWESDS